MEDMAKKVLPFISPILPFVLRNKWFTKKIIGKIEEPIHFIRCSNLINSIF